jgi:hypothetical protein
MAIKLEVYLKRTEQTMKDWMRANDITNANELLPRCAYLGLAASMSDVALAAQILKSESESEFTTIPVEPVESVEPVEPVEPVVESEISPATVDRPKKKRKSDNSNIN